VNRSLPARSDGPGGPRAIRSVRVRPGGRRRGPWLDADTRAGWALILPFFLFFSLFVLYPLVQNLFNSFLSFDLTRRTPVGLANYARLLTDTAFHHSVRNTLVYAAASIGPLMVLGFVAALCVDGVGRGMAPARAVLVFPYVLSMVSVSMVWLYLYDPGSGLFNRILAALGLPGSAWLFDEKLALACLVAMNIWKTLGYVTIIDLAALQGVPASLHEAARVDGAGFLRRTRHITLPAIRPVSAFLLATLSIECFKTFDQVRIMTNGGPVDATTTIAHQIYVRAFSEFKMGYASAESMVLFLLVLAVTLVNLRLGDPASRDAAGRRR
jgi:multiple sugar transport system permease protein/raffinose/stachyose/melibiose transport system permease protein